MDKLIDKIARYMHCSWKVEKEKNGFHLPKNCPNFEKKYDKETETMDDDFIHCSKCNINMCEFDKLENFVKEQYYKKAERMNTEMSENGLKIEIID